MNIQNVSREGESSMITMFFIGKEIKDLSLHSFYEGDMISIDWGDGNIDEFRTVMKSSAVDAVPVVYYTTGIFGHKYCHDTLHIITVRGNIRGLYCEGCPSAPLSSLDVSRCPALKELDCHYNNLTFLDVSQCPGLTYLDCSSNSLTSLNVSGCTKLEMLNCSLNKDLNDLYVNDNPALNNLDCSGDDLTSLDVSNNTALTTLDCSYNFLEAEALNRIFSDLPASRKGYIHIKNNPGEETCNRSIAEKKKWEIRRI